MTLDDAVAARGWARLDFLNIDAEGFDFHFLRGASRLFRDRRVRVVQFEYNASCVAAGSS